MASVFTALSDSYESVSAFSSGFVWSTTTGVSPFSVSAAFWSFPARSLNEIENVTAPSLSVFFTVYWHCHFFLSLLPDCSVTAGSLPTTVPPLLTLAFAHVGVPTTSDVSNLIVILSPVVASVFTALSDSYESVLAFSSGLVLSIVTFLLFVGAVTWSPSSSSAFLKLMV